MECLEYEKHLKYMSYPIFQNAILGKAYTYPDCHIADLYYISNEQDFKLFLECQGFHGNEWYFDNDYYEYGPGWYIWWHKEMMDSHDMYYLYNLDNYIKKAKEGFNSWLNEINNMTGREKK